MSLGTAVLLFFIGCGLGLLGLIFLVRWLFRIAKRNPEATKVYHVLTAITGVVLISAVVIILFFLPKPLSKLPQELLDCYPIAHSGKDFWMITKPVRGPLMFDRYDLAGKRHHPLAQIEEERSRNIFMHSFATDGRLSAVTFSGDENYLLVFRGDSVLLNENSKHTTFVSYDKTTQHFLVGKQLWPDDLEFSAYDRNFRLLECDTFRENDASKTFTFGPHELQYIGNTWYANCDQQTYKLRFSHDSCYYVPYSNGDESLFVLDGSLDHLAHDKIITEKGIVLTGLPDVKDDNGVFGTGAWYELDGEKQTWQYMPLQFGQREFHYHRWLANERFSLAETGEANNRYRTYRISYNGKGESKFRVLDFPSLAYQDEIVIPWKDSIGIYYRGFSDYAVFDLVTGERLDKTGMLSPLHEIVHDRTLEMFVFAGCGLFLCWMVALLVLRMKNAAAITKAWTGLISLLFFFFLLLPGILILVAAWND